MASTMLPDKLVSFLRARGGRAEWHEMIAETGLANAPKAVACKMLRSILEGRTDCAEPDDGTWQLVSGTPRVEPAGGTVGQTVSLPEPQSDRLRYDKVEPAGGARVPSVGEDQLDRTRFTVLCVLPENRPRGRAVVVAFMPITGMKAGKVIRLPLGKLRGDRFIPNMAELMRLQESLELGVAVVVHSDAETLLSLKHTFETAGMAWPPLATFDLEKIRRQLGRMNGVTELPGDKGRSAQGWLGSSPDTEEAVESAARAVADEFIRLLERLIERGVNDVFSLVAFQEAPLQAVSFEWRRFDRSTLLQLPTAPAVYWFLDRRGAVLYVGKAKNLRERVSIYFSGACPEEEKARRLLAEAFDLQYFVVGSELEALLEEQRRIRVCLPPLNSQTEVHERKPTYARTRDLILFLPSSRPDHIEVFLVSPSHGHDQVRVKKGKRCPHSLVSRVKRYFIGAPPKRGRAKATQDEPAAAKVEKKKLCKLLWHGHLAHDSSRAGRPCHCPTSGRGDYKSRDFELELIYSWFQANRDNVSFIDVGKTAGSEDCLRLVNEYLTSEEATLRKVEFH